MAGYARAYSARSVLKRVSVFSFSFRAGYAQEEPYTLRVGRIRSEFAQGERIQQGAGYAQVLFFHVFMFFELLFWVFARDIPKYHPGANGAQVLEGKVGIRW